MPYSSEAQRRWAHTAAGKKALGGEAHVHEWDEATKGRKLPEKVEKSLASVPKTSVPSATKMPKAKSLPQPGDKPSVFFKSEAEEFPEVKHPTLAKLKHFLQNKRLKNKK